MIESLNKAIDELKSAHNAASAVPHLRRKVVELRWECAKLLTKDESLMKAFDLLSETILLMQKAGLVNSMSQNLLNIKRGVSGAGMALFYLVCPGHRTHAEVVEYFVNDQWFLLLHSIFHNYLKTV